ncbi:MAG: hypothetical protein ABIG64_01145 [Candidatus Omnitrophota bacterium]
MNKAIVVFYSYSGNTEKIAHVLRNCLEELYQTDVIRLDSLDEPKSFFKQCWRALIKKTAVIKEDIRFDLKDYAVIAIGTPVWAFGPAPAVRTYLKKVKGLNGKKIVLFGTYGSGAGKDKCIETMTQELKDKEVKEIKSFLIQQFKVNAADEVKDLINKVLKNEK